MSQLFLFFSVLCVQTGNDHYAGPVRGRPPVVDGGHGWERASMLSRLPLGTVTRRQHEAVLKVQDRMQTKLPGGWKGRSFTPLQMGPAWGAQSMRG